MIVIGFDRDQTVDVNGGPVPLGLVKQLAAMPGFEVWAIGNQLLKVEAGIPGIDEMRARLGLGDKHVQVGTADQAADTGTKRERNIAAKMKRLSMLAQIFPDAAMRIVVDDFDLSAAPGWTWFSPADFMSSDFEHPFSESGFLDPNA